MDEARLKGKMLLKVKSSSYIMSFESDYRHLSITLQEKTRCIEASQIIQVITLVVIRNLIDLLPFSSYNFGEINNRGDVLKTLIGL